MASGCKDQGIRNLKLKVINQFLFQNDKDIEDMIYDLKVWELKGWCLV